MEKKKSHAFGKDIYLLGKDKDGINYWLEEASWDCGWYWGFGYVETYTNNKYPHLSRDINSHQHFDGLFLKGAIFDSFKSLLVETPLSDNEIWKLLELMDTFYTLRESADLFKNGGSHITTNPLMLELKDEKIYNNINQELLPRVFKEIYKILSPEKEEDEDGEIKQTNVLFN